PNDIIGTQIFNYGSGTFTTQLGPVHANVVLLDEINRSSAKTQSAMLEAMQERQTSIGGEVHRLPEPFMVLATQNPIEEEGTYVLPEAQMDRFLMKEILTYPRPGEEHEILDRSTSGSLTGPRQAVGTVTLEDVRFLQAMVDQVYVDPAIKRYIIDLIFTTRGSGPRPVPNLTQSVRVGASPRGSLALMRVAQAHALLQGRDYVIPDDLHTSNRARGLIQGRGRSLFKGSGEDFDDLKYYQPGDKISDIDWKATARSGEPLIRQFNEERVRHLSIVVDTSSAMAATAGDGTSKRDAMILAAGMICFLAQKNGDLVGMVAGHERRPIQLPSRSSDGHLELLLRTAQQATTTASASPDSAWLLERAFRVTARPTLMTIITDEAHPTVEDFALLRRLTTRHDVIVIRIADADPLQGSALDDDV